jgi:hypothetical protein
MYLNGVRYVSIVHDPVFSINNCHIICRYIILALDKKWSLPVQLSTMPQGVWEVEVELDVFLNSALDRGQ